MWPQYHSLVLKGFYFFCTRQDFSPIRSKVREIQAQKEDGFFKSTHARLGLVCLVGKRLSAGIFQFILETLGSSNILTLFSVLRWSRNHLFTKANKQHWNLTSALFSIWVNFSFPCRNITKQRLCFLSRPSSESWNFRKGWRRMPCGYYLDLLFTWSEKKQKQKQKFYRMPITKSFLTLVWVCISLSASLNKII